MPAGSISSGVLICKHAPHSWATRGWKIPCVTAASIPANSKDYVRRSLIAIVDIGSRVVAPSLDIGIGPRATLLGVLTVNSAPRPSGLQFNNRMSDAIPDELAVAITAFEHLIGSLDRGYLGIGFVFAD